MEIADFARFWSGGRICRRILRSEKSLSEGVYFFSRLVSRQRCGGADFRRQSAFCADFSGNFADDSFCSFEKFVAD